MGGESDRFPMNEGHEQEVQWEGEVIHPNW